MSSTLLAVLGVLLAVVGVVLMRRYPRAAFVTWTLVLCFVPYWTGITLQVYFSPATLIGALLVISLIPAAARWTIVDLLIALIVGIFLFGVIVGYATIASGYVLVSQWALGYLIGRLIVSRIDLSWLSTVLAIALTVVAALAIVEFVTQTNLFVAIHTGNQSLYAEWGTIQLRGGVPRSEGAFGHSIALGVSIAMAVPFAIVARLPLVARLSMLIVMIAGVVTTFSRIGMITAGIGFLATLLFVRTGLSRRARGVLLTVGILAALVATPLVANIFSDAGTEASGSAAYRGDLLSLIPKMALVGLSPSAYRAASGDVYYGSFQSIDSAIIFFGLNHGLIPMVIVLLILLAAVLLVLRGRATAPLVSVVAQIPALATVALITQEAMFFWFMAGLAVSSLAARPSEDGQSPFGELSAGRLARRMEHSPISLSAHPIPKSAVLGTAARMKERT